MWFSGMDASMVKRRAGRSTDCSDPDTSVPPPMSRPAVYPPRLDTVRDTEECRERRPITPSLFFFRVIMLVTWLGLVGLGSDCLGVGGDMEF